MTEVLVLIDAPDGKATEAVTGAPDDRPQHR